MPPKPPKKPPAPTPAAPAGDDAAVDALLDGEDEGAQAPAVAPPTPPAPPPAATAPVEAKPRGARRYRVKVTKQLSLGGFITHLSSGDIVSESSYGPLGMQRIIDAGVQLEELPD